MTRLFVAGAVVAAVISGTSVSRAADAPVFQDGNGLYELCTAPKDSFAQGICVGFVESVADAMSSSNKVNGDLACQPNEATVEQNLDIVLQFLRTHSDLRKYATASLVAEALDEAFPCPK